MLLVGLTGGIGAGKSTAGKLFAARGAVLVDADQVARSVMEPGGAAFDAVIERFGESIVRTDTDRGRVIDRQALARQAFGDSDALADLERIVHPLVWDGVRHRLAAASRDAVAVIELPLLGREAATSGDGSGGIAAGPAPGADYRDVPLPEGSLRWVVTVDCPTEVCIKRLVGGRGMTPEEAAARIAAQPSRDRRLRIADIVIENSAGMSHLETEVSRAWQRIKSTAGPDL
ncbi:MAG: dephospho-CoA kinase [Actinomycetota bacterium]|nr:dephospho-CoA kinase [Actinomycetota bacterium]